MTDLDLEVLGALKQNYKVEDIAVLLEVNRGTIYRSINHLIVEGRIERIGSNHYRFPEEEQSSEPIESRTMKVEIPAFLRARPTIVLFVERSPEEVHNVFRLEVQLEDHWFPIPTYGDTRVCIGPDIPRWSPAQETYYGIQSYRTTATDGTQKVYAHNPNEPITIDRK